MQKTAHIDLIYCRLADAVVAIFLYYKGLVNKITEKCSEKCQQRHSSLKPTDIVRSG